MKWEEVSYDLRFIGNNLIDFYFGQLGVEQICSECTQYFQKNNIYKSQQFFKWLGCAHWKKIILSDQSEWMVRSGNSSERFIHIHPAKFSKHTIRVKGTTLKTVLTLCILDVPIQQNPDTNLRAVNNYRNELLGLSPVKSLVEPVSKIMYLWKIFKNNSSD